MNRKWLEIKSFENGIDDSVVISPEVAEFTKNMTVDEIDAYINDWCKEHDIHPNKN